MPKGEWIRGFKYDDTKTAEGRKLTRQDLDTAAPDNPVIVRHRGGHTGFANALALQKLDFKDSTPDPAGGQLGRDVQGHLTGELRGTAMDRTRGLDVPPSYLAALGVALLVRIQIPASNEGRDRPGVAQLQRILGHVQRRGQLDCRRMVSVPLRK